MPSVSFTRTRGETVPVLFDEEDALWVKGLPSRRLYGRARKTYAKFTLQVDKEIRSISLARLIAGLSWDDPREVDHINGDSLDNRRSNLRIVSRAMQQQNLQAETVRRGQPPSSRYRGVVWISPRSKWRVWIQVCGQRVFGGEFRDEDEAGSVAQNLYDQLLEEAFDNGCLERPSPVPAYENNVFLQDVLDRLESRSTRPLVVPRPDIQRMRRTA